MGYTQFMIAQALAIATQHIDQGHGRAQRIGRDEHPTW
jgi:hypothetical protein